MYGDKFYTETWKNHSNILTNFNCISAKTGQIFYDKATNTSVLNESKGFLKAGSVKIRTCISVICDNFNVIVPFVSCILLEQCNLIFNTLTIFAVLTGFPSEGVYDLSPMMFGSQRALALKAS